MKQVSGVVDRQELKDILADFMNQVTTTLEKFENKIKTCEDHYEERLKMREDKFLECIEARLSSQDALVPPTPGQEERDTLGPMGNFSRSPPTTPKHGSTSTMLDASQLATLHISDSYGQEHGRPGSSPGAAQEPKLDWPRPQLENV